MPRQPPVLSAAVAFAAGGWQMVFMIPGMDVTVRVNGRVEVLEPGELASLEVRPEIHRPDANAGLIQGLKLSIDEAYFHCPRAFQFADLWNPASIAANAALSLKDLR